MPQTLSVSMSASIAGLSMSGSLQRTGSGALGGDLSLAAGNAGSITTRTDNDTAVITATSSDHDIVSTDVVDVYWGSGSTAGIRRGMVATVSGTAISVDGGAGDNLPALTTAVVVDKQQTLNIDFTAAEAILAAASAQYRASVAWQEGDGTAVLNLDLCKSGTDGEVWSWANYTNVSTPFGANVGKVVMSNGNSSNANAVNLGVLLDNDS